MDYEQRLLRYHPPRLPGDSMRKKENIEPAHQHTEAADDRQINKQSDSTLHLVHRVAHSLHPHTLTIPTRQRASKQW